MTDDQLVERWLEDHPRLRYENLTQGCTFHLCRDTWFYLVLHWARHDLGLA